MDIYATSWRSRLYSCRMSPSSTKSQSKFFLLPMLFLLIFIRNMLFSHKFLILLIFMQSCMKIAMDFVSPESIQECIRITEEFRKLPAGHHSQEDKLEVMLFLIIFLARLGKSLLELDSEMGHVTGFHEFFKLGLTSAVARIGIFFIFNSLT